MLQAASIAYCTDLAVRPELNAQNSRGPADKLINAIQRGDKAWPRTPRMDQRKCSGGWFMNAASSPTSRCSTSLIARTVRRSLAPPPKPSPLHLILHV